VIGISMGGALAVSLAGGDESGEGRWSHCAISGDAAVGRSGGAVGVALGSGSAAGAIQRWTSILDPKEQERSLAYGVFSAKGLRALHTIVEQAVAALPRVTAPTIMIQSREDNRVTGGQRRAGVCSTVHLYAASKRVYLYENRLSCGSGRMKYAAAYATRVHQWL
jgi:hypothetical protein